jgi:hypothetical protein
MTTDSFFALMCGGMIGLLFGLVLAFAGYRLFLILLPIWGFFFGFAFGAQAMQMIFGEAFLATVTSWVVGFIVALIFAVLSYLFYIFAVALVAGSLGYSVTVGLLMAIGMQSDFRWDLGGSQSCWPSWCCASTSRSWSSNSPRPSWGRAASSAYSWRCSAACPRHSWSRIRWRRR